MAEPRTALSTRREAEPDGPSPRGSFRRRWFSRRAALLHLEVALVAPACAAAGWWQATRALGGHALSWFYSIEWPVFALLAIIGWWYLLHEDPAAYATRKAKPAPAAAVPSLPRGGSLDARASRLALGLAVLVALELVAGIAALALVPFSRPSAVLPSRGSAVFVAHASLGIPLAAGALVFVLSTRRAGRIARLAARVGLVGVGLASIGGLLALAHPSRLAGVAAMLLGSVIAGIGYLFPTFERLGD